MLRMVSLIGNAAGKSELSVTSAIKVQDGQAIWTSGTEYVVASLPGIEEGVYSIAESKAFGAPRASGVREDAFPEIAVMEGEFLPLSPGQQAQALACLPYISDDETRYFMNGFHAGDGYLTATDGRRLYAAPGWEGFPEAIVKPTKILQKLLKSATGLAFRADGKTAEFRGNFKGLEFRYGSTLVQGQFPRWKKAVPEAPKYSIPIPARLLVLLDIVAKLPKGEEGERVWIDGSPEAHGLVSLAYGEATIGEFAWPGFYSAERIAAEDKRSLPSLAINHRYLRDALRLSPSAMRFTSFESALIFDNPDGSFSVVMPMRQE